MPCGGSSISVLPGQEAGPCNMMLCGAHNRVWSVGLCGAHNRVWTVGHLMAVQVGVRLQLGHFGGTVGAGH